MSHRSSWLLSLPALALTALCSAQTPSQPSQPGRTSVHAAHLVDVRSGRLLDDQTLVVSGDRIVAVGPASQVKPQPGDKTIDLGDATLLPGLIDVHTHLTDDTNFDPYDELTTTIAKSALIGARNAKVTLQAGITTVRNVGADGFADVDLATPSTKDYHRRTAHAGQRTGARNHRRAHGQQPAAGVVPLCR